MPKKGQLISDPSWPLPRPLPRREGRSMWGYPYWAANKVLGLFFLSLRVVFSLTVGISFSHRTHRFNRSFWRTFRAHRRPSAYRIHRTFQLRLAVMFCDIGWLNVSVRLCVFCFSVYFCEKKKCPQREKEMSSVKERIVLCEGINTNQKDSNCQDISATTLLSFRGNAFQCWRRRPSTIKNMPFLPQEGHVLQARRAYS